MDTNTALSALAAGGVAVAAAYLGGCCTDAAAPSADPTPPPTPPPDAGSKAAAPAPQPRPAERPRPQPEPQPQPQPQPQPAPRPAPPPAAAAPPPAKPSDPTPEAPTPDDPSGSPDMRLDPDTQRSLDAVDALIDKLELPQATEQLVALVEELKQQPLKVHGCIQAMDVLGQCYIMQRQLKKALKVYDNLVQMVEGSRELSESRLYVAGYAIRGGLHEKIADSGYAQRCARLLPPCTPLEWPSTFAAGYRRDADYKTATDGGAPVGRLCTSVSVPIREQTEIPGSRRVCVSPGGLWPRHRGPVLREEQAVQAQEAERPGPGGVGHRPQGVQGRAQGGRGVAAHRGEAFRRSLRPGDPGYWRCPRARRKPDR